MRGGIVLVRIGAEGDVLGHDEHFVRPNGLRLPVQFDVVRARNDVEQGLIGLNTAEGVHCFVMKIPIPKADQLKFVFLSADDGGRIF